MINEDVCIRIATLVNTSLQQSIISEIMEPAKVIHIYKAKSKQEFSKYCPIPLLSNISKITEKDIHKRIYPLLKKHHIHYNQPVWF